MEYLTVTMEEATDPITGALKPGYEKWAYVYKLVIPDTPEEVAAKAVKAAKPAKAVLDLQILIAIENPDPLKWKIEEIVAHIKGIETLLGIR